MKLIDLVYKDVILARVLVKNEDVDKLNDIMKAYLKEHKAYKQGTSVSDYLVSQFGAINVGFNPKRIDL